MNFKKIYAANGAISKSSIYKKYYKKIELISVSSKRNFEKNPDVRKRIINFKPDRIYVRFGKVSMPKKLKNCSSCWVKVKSHPELSSKV